MNEELKDDLTNMIEKSVNDNIDMIINQMIYNHCKSDRNIDYHELKESILLRILKLK